MKRGANPSAKDKGGYTTNDYAKPHKSVKYKEVERLLKEYKEKRNSIGQKVKRENSISQAGPSTKRKHIDRERHV